MAGEAADYGAPESEAARELSQTIAKLRVQLAAAEAEEEAAAAEAEEEAAAAEAIAGGEEGGETADASAVATLVRRHAKLQAEVQRRGAVLAREQRGHAPLILTLSLTPNLNP